MIKILILSQIFFILSFAPFEMVVAQEPGRCTAALSRTVGSEVNLFEGDSGVEANAVAIKTYPLELMSFYLGITPELKQQMKNKNILLVGEGDGKMLPQFLADISRSTEALDIWYHAKTFPDSKRGHELQAFNEKYSQHLVTGSGANMPFSDGIYDYIFSHKLLNNLSFDESVKVLLESSRVLADSGEARIDTLGVGPATDFIIFRYMIESNLTYDVQINSHGRILIKRKPLSKRDPLKRMQRLLPKDLTHRPFNERLSLLISAMEKGEFLWLTKSQLDWIQDTFSPSNELQRSIRDAVEQSSRGEISNYTNKGNHFSASVIDLLFQLHSLKVELETNAATNKNHTLATLTDEVKNDIINLFSRESKSMRSNDSLSIPDRQKLTLQEECALISKVTQMKALDRLQRLSSQIDILLFQLKDSFESSFLMPEWAEHVYLRGDGNKEITLLEVIEKIQNQLDAN